MRNRATSSMTAMRCCTPLIALAVLTSGCVMQRPHYKSFIKLRAETAENYSQQVLDAMADVLDKGHIPVFFSIEAGQSGWQPRYSGGITAVIPAPWRSDTTTLQPNFSGGEGLSNSIQFNDFGSAAMIRISALYGLVCLPQEVAGVKLPNGVLYTIASISKNRKDFLMSAKLSDGRWLGVPEEKKSEFIAFARDVTYWARGGAPDPKDLLSVPGTFYRCSAEYASAQLSMAQAVGTKQGMAGAVAPAQAAYEATLREFEALKEEAKTTDTNPQIMATLLQFKREEVQAKQQAVAGVAGQVGQAESTIASSRRKITSLYPLISGTFERIAANDPDVGPINVEGIISSIDGHISQLSAGDQKVLQEIANMLPHSAGLNANDSVDDLYRERFESLPQQFEQAFQAEE